MLFAFEEGAEVGAGGVGFDAALDFGEFAFGTALLQGFDAAFGFLPSEFAGIFEKDFEEDAAIAFVELGADFGGLNRVARERDGHQGGKDFFGFESDVKLGLIEAMRDFEAIDST